MMKVDTKIIVLNGTNYHVWARWRFIFCEEIPSFCPCYTKSQILVWWIVKRWAPTYMWF